VTASPDERPDRSRRVSGGRGASNIIRTLGVEHSPPGGRRRRKVLPEGNDRLTVAAS
jgi:hypothetical protein